MCSVGIVFRIDLRMNETENRDWIHDTNFNTVNMLKNSK